MNPDLAMPEHRKSNAVKLSAAMFLAMALGACGGETQPTDQATDATSPAQEETTLETIIAGDHRTEEERARDVYRHPKETLEFFGLEPDMTVVEVWPGGGWYTQIIAPYLKSGGGKYYAAHFPREGASEYATSALNAFDQNYVEQPEIYGDIEVTALGKGHHIAPENSADLVVTFRNVHNWRSRETKLAMFEEFYRALKPGGVLGVVEHRADGADVKTDGSAGYIYTDEVKEIAAEAGFDFDQSSEINANAADTKDHPFGVWTLPPTRRSSEVRGQDDPDFDRAKYDAIGESDRMTLKFRKPIAADGALLE
ncbi:class I SAM-dependent methyltransferase [Hyphococcus sp. DH-69]|uniref:class I SAM-dependent methyltransferase n=1 Tax=Hyphococcus formosus TaxID=3143534 RepID=UPI00398B0301